MAELLQAGIFFLKGVLIGVSIAAPVGPIGVLCMQKTFSGGFRTGLLTGAGAACADAIYGFVGAFGLVFVSGYIIDYQGIMHVAGGLFLCYLGASIFLKHPATPAASVKKGWGASVPAFFLTLSNPVTVLMFIAVFAGLGVGNANGDYALASALVIGVFTGSLLWWVLLSFIVATLRTSLTHNQLRWVNRVAGVIMVFFGGYALATY